MLYHPIVEIMKAIKNYFGPPEGDDLEGPAFGTDQKRVSNDERQCDPD